MQRQSSSRTLSRYAMPLNLPKLHDFIYQNIAAVIPGDLDYAIPLQNHPKAKL
jgi:hypothetical protein